LASNVNQAGYSSATDGVNTFSMANAGGTTPVSNKTKFSTYILHELPHVGLNPGESVTVPLSSYNAAGATTAPSFGNPNALLFSASNVTAVWSGSTAVTVTLLAGTTSPVAVYVIASPVASGAIGTDQDKESIAVYTNLLANGQFTTSAVTSAWGLQLAPGAYPNQAPGTWVASTTDRAGNVANGVYVFSFAASGYGVKATPFGNYLPFAAGNWYTARMKIADAVPGNTDEALLFNFSTAIGNGYTADVGAEAFVTSIPTVFTWMEAPFYCHVAETGFPQFQLKGNEAGGVFIAEIQVIQATPKILDGTRGNVRAFYNGGLFAQSTSTTLWGTQVYTGSSQQPAISLTSDTAIGSALSMVFNGAANASGSFYGLKWTAQTPSSPIYTPTATVGRQNGVTLELNPVIPLAAAGGDLSIALVAKYDVATNGASAFDKLDAAAETGVLTEGTLATVGAAVDPFAQVQFGFRGDASGTIDISNVDYISAALWYLTADCL